jgi:hypothetical protein
VVGSDAQGITLIALRNGLLVAATVVGARLLWKHSVTGAAALPAGDPVEGAAVTPDATSDTSATAG